MGLTDPLYNTSKSLQFIPNMDGFPNGRRLEDDVTTIELQAVSGVALAAIGLFYDDATPASPVSPRLLSVLTFDAGITKNDTTFRTNFPYVQTPWRAFNGPGYEGPSVITATQKLELTPPEVVMVAGPNPFQSSVSLRYKMTIDGNVVIRLIDVSGRQIEVLDQGYQNAGSYTVHWNGSYLTPRLYMATLLVNGKPYTTVKLLKN